MHGWWLPCWTMMIKNISSNIGSSVGQSWFRHVRMHAKWLRLCPTLFDPLDCSPPGFFVRGILQAGIIEWVAISFSRRSYQPRDQPSVSSVSCIGRRVLGPPGKPVPDIVTNKWLLNRTNNNLLAHNSQLLLNIQTLTLFEKVIVGVYLPKIL